MSICLISHILSDSYYITKFKIGAVHIIFDWTCTCASIEKPVTHLLTLSLYLASI